MSATHINTSSEFSAALELRTIMQGTIVLRDDDNYARTRRIWNRAVEKQPALFAVCETSADVQAAEHSARRHGLPFSVRGGGHQWAGLALCQDGQPMLMLRPLWNGDARRGDHLMRDLHALGTPQLAQVGPMTYSDMLALYDAWVDAADHCHWEMRTRSLAVLVPDAIDVIASAVAARTSPYSMVNWHHLHGAATRIPAEATAFGVHEKHFMLEIIAALDTKRE